MMTWRTVRVTYYADQDRLIADAIEPAFNRLWDRVASAYFVRHWRQGPHVRLNFLCSFGAYQQVIKPEIERTIEPYLRHRPSSGRLDHKNMETLHRRLAEDEHELGPLSPWFPDNTISWTRYDSRQHVLGPAEAAMLAKFYDHTTGLAFEMTRAILNGTSRAQAAFDLMIATAHVLSGVTIETGFVSFRSHAEAFLAYSPTSKGLRDKWGQHYAQRSNGLRERLRKGLAALDSGSPDPFVQQWLEILDPLKWEVAQLITDGRMALMPPGGNSDLRELSSPVRESAYHDWISHTKEARATVESASWFLTYRWVLNCTYLHMTRIGLAPVDRFFLCTLAANAVEHELGVQAVDVVERLLRDAQQTSSSSSKGV
jgi:hypothetical protein